MNREEAKEYIKNNPERYLKRAKKTGYICPLCQNGTGATGDGLALNPKDKDGTHYKCFVCGFSGDIIDLIGKEYNLTDHKDIFNKAYEIYNITIESDLERGTTKKAQNKEKRIDPKPEQGKLDHTEFFLKAQSNLQHTDYLSKRGISIELQKRFNIGYVEKWKSPTALKNKRNPPDSPRIIIPTSKYSYLARDTREDLVGIQKQYSKMKEGETEIFNPQALNEDRPVFIVEGEIDALSIMEVDGVALALGSISNTDKLIALVKDKKPQQPLIISLDNEKSGTPSYNAVEKAKKKIINAFEELNLIYYMVNISGDWKDSNKALTEDREGFKRSVQQAEDSEKAEREDYIKTSAKYHLQSFINGVTDSVNTPVIKTGFNQLDAIMDGGLYEGLYAIGAISSLGKTTLILQIADQIAQAGKDVLIFSLEMARTELMAKSISRLTILACEQYQINTKNAKTSRGITDGRRYQNYSKEEREVIRLSHNVYDGYADHIYINEGVGDIGIKEIKQTVKKHITLTGNKPVIIVDYLQIMSPYNERATDKQNTDKAVTELKRLSRDYKLPVIAISSFNRQSYKEAVTMEAFKETGGIEYSSDVVIGLQLKGTSEKGFDVNKAKRQNPRQVELVILKQRNGATGDKIDYDYYPLFNYFKESDKDL